MIGGENMCTSITMMTQDFYFGRTMDLEYEFNQRIVVTPRYYPIAFRKAGISKRHYAIIGMATVVNGYPLYADAVNEEGLCIAGLNFPDDAYYPPEENYNKVNISPFELILWLLCKCATAEEAKSLLQNTHLIDIPFSKDIPLIPLHWHIADKKGSLVIEVTKKGMNLYDNPSNVLTNSPSFDFHMMNLSQYLNLTPNFPQNRFCTNINLKPSGNGLGSFGLPGDFSPSSRFVRASYLGANSACEGDEQSSVAQFFHILDSVSLIKGSVLTQDDLCDVTIYSCCMNASKGIYYYKTYYNNRITAVNMNHEKLNSCGLKEFPLIDSQQIAWMN